ncbi:gene transfer agent family protein [Rhizobium sp. 0TCS1.26]|uniref:gene transfer agent family protein n=1 Tax=Rhizobium sp. 0TCS1.26 TaxID=3142623 RepID=UPI003D2DC446
MAGDAGGYGPGVRLGRANRRRGEVEAMIDGERRILCLTLGALAELETAFGADDLSDLAARFSSGRLRAGDLVCVMAAGLRGGGNCFSDEEVAAMSVDGGIPACARVAADLLEAAFTGPQTEAAPNPPQPQQHTSMPDKRSPGRS